MATYDGNNIRRYQSTDLIAPGGKPEDIFNNLASDISNAITNLLAANFVAGSSTARDSYWGVPTNSTTQRALQDRGAHTVRTDLGWTERYFATWNGSTNPGGAAVAGWSPVSGKMPYIVARRSTTQSVGTTAAAITFNAIDETHQIGWTSGTPTRLNINISGNYLFNVLAEVGSTTRGYVFLRRNGSGDLGIFDDQANSSGISKVAFTLRVPLSAGDYVELLAGTNVSANLYNAYVYARYLDPRQQ